MTYLMNQISQLIQLSKKSAETEPVYEVLEYLELDGTQYFDTELIASDLGNNDYYRVRGIFQGTRTFSTSQIMFGISASAGGWCGIPSSKSYYGFGTSNLSTVAYNTESFFDISITNISTSATNKRWSISGTVDGNTISTRTGAANYPQSNYTFIIGASRQQDDATSISFGSGMKIKSCRIFNNTTEVKNYVPVLDSQMRPCLYDRVSKTFLYHQNTGTSTTVPTYKRWNKFDVDYIESSGTQYIDTGIKANDITSIYCKYAGTFALTYANKTYSGQCFGSRVSTSSNAFYYANGVDNDTVGNGSSIKAVTKNTNTTFSEITYSKTAYEIEGDNYNESGALSIGSITSNFNFYLFGINDNGTPNLGTWRYKAFKINTSNGLIRDFKPTVWHNGNTTAVACLYDEVYNKMYTNAGTGSFKAYIISKDGTTTYEVGSNCFVTPTTNGNYFNSGLYANENWNVRLLAYTSTNVTGQLFGVVKGADYPQNLTINACTATGTGSLSRFDSKVTTQSDIIHMGASEKALLQTCEYGLWQDSTRIMAWSNPDTFTTEQPCHICKVNGSTGFRPNGCCYCLIEENNVPIAEYIPVRNATVTSSYGLYDRISGTLNTGIGTITFNSLS